MIVVTRMGRKVSEKSHFYHRAAWKIATLFLIPVESISENRSYIGTIMNAVFSSIKAFYYLGKI
jgi:hypothetical protein